MNSKLKWIGFASAIVMAVILYMCCINNHEKKLASMIRNGDAAGVLKLMKSHPRLINCSLDSRTKLTPLDLAASLEREMICSNLIAFGAEINARNEAGETALFFASRCVNTNIVSMLLQHGANVSITNIDGQTPLLYLGMSGETNAVKLLLQYGADPAQRDRYGKSPLDYAKEANDNDIVAMFLNAMSRMTN